MSRTLYNAIMEIAENGERFPAFELNVSRRTVKALAKRGWIETTNGHAFVTSKGWDAVATL